VCRAGELVEEEPEEPESLLETIVPLGRLLHGATAASSAASQGFAAASSFLWSGWGAVSERVSHSVEATLEVAKTTGRSLAEQVLPQQHSIPPRCFAGVKVAFPCLGFDEQVKSGTEAALDAVIERGVACTHVLETVLGGLSPSHGEGGGASAGAGDGASPASPSGADAGGGAPSDSSSDHSNNHDSGSGVTGAEAPPPPSTAAPEAATQAAPGASSPAPVVADHGGVPATATAFDV
jgi:hypothetical protein